IVDAGRDRRMASGEQQPLDVVEADAGAEDLDEAAQPPGDLDEASGVAPGEIAGAQPWGTELRAEIGRSGRVAHHHVGPFVDELALDPRLAHRLAVVVDDREAAARDR